MRVLFLLAFVMTSLAFLGAAETGGPSIVNHTGVTSVTTLVTIVGAAGKTVLARAVPTFSTVPTTGDDADEYDGDMVTSGGALDPENIAKLKRKLLTFIGHNVNEPENIGITDLHLDMFAAILDSYISLDLQNTPIADYESFVESANNFILLMQTELAKGQQHLENLESESASTPSIIRMLSEYLDLTSVIGHGRLDQKFWLSQGITLEEKILNFVSRLIRTARSFVIAANAQKLFLMELEAAYANGCQDDLDAQGCAQSTDSAFQQFLAEQELLNHQQWHWEE